MMRRLGFLALLLVLLGTGYGALTWWGQHEGPGTVTKDRVPPPMVLERDRSQHRALRSLANSFASVDAPATPPKKVLFGDLHLHTTFSFDAFITSLPMLGGSGQHLPAHACDYARFVSRLDFWAITDHAEGLTPRHWREIVRSVRACQAAASREGEPPDLISFLGWEWSQLGPTPQDHYGNRNIVVKHLDEKRVPERPILSVNPHSVTLPDALPPGPVLKLLALLDGWSNFDRMADLDRYLEEIFSVPVCRGQESSSAVEGHCYEVAQTPRRLFQRLDRLDQDALAIPHGTAWGNQAPPGTDWRRQLEEGHHHPDHQRLVEVFSGHGNSEEYRSFRSVTEGEDGKAVCPRPTEDYEPCCWRAGKIIRERCPNPGSKACEKRVRRARKNFLRTGKHGFKTIPGTEASDWKDCEVCRSCFLPAHRYRPKMSVQYMLALRGFPEDGSAPRSMSPGIVASGDNHSGRPGTGFKETDRRTMTDIDGPPSFLMDWVQGDEDSADSSSLAPSEVDTPPFGGAGLDGDRQASMLYTGGLAAVHAESRSREAIWSAFKRREVYGTSGPRILLWFDLIDGSGSDSYPMGSAVDVEQPPRFRVRAVGARRQKPGCPDFVRDALGAERLRRLSEGECYYPGDERHAIEALEVVRIRRQSSPDSPVDSLIEDPWKRFECSGEKPGCTAVFSDTDYDPTDDPRVLYYARALQEPTPTINGRGLRCQEYGKDGQCTKIKPCYEDARTHLDSDCTAPRRARAWSSPIYLRPGGSARNTHPHAHGPSGEQNA